MEPGDLILGQVVIKRFAVVKLGVTNESGDCRSSFGIKVWTDTAKLTKKIWRQMSYDQKVACLSNMKIFNATKSFGPKAEKL